MNPSHCILCEQESLDDFPCPPQRYLHCKSCHLVFLHPQDRLSVPQEKAHYDLHQNHPSDSGYRQFLSRALAPVTEQLHPPASGLDFGCGPGPTLSVMLREQGYVCADYDPIYQPEPARLDQRYDFVTCTEVIEHAREPAQTWPLLLRLLKPKGLLVVMTKRLTSLEAFVDWHYRRDPTHICFYSEKTFSWLANRHALKLNIHGPDVVSFQRTGRCA